MTYTLGIDLGTSFVAAAVGGAGRCEMLPLGEHAPESPACLGWAGSMVVGDAARQQGLTSGLRLIEGVKRRVGDPTPISVGGTMQPVEYLIAALLRPVLDRAIRQQSAAPDRVVLTHPASWGPYRRNALAEAARVAGLPHIETVTDAQAAVTEYLSRQSVPPGRIIGVYDLGGGMFDAALVRFTGDGLEPVGTAEGFENLGGLDFDVAVLDHVRRGVGAAFEELDLADPEAAAMMIRLLRECVRAKEELSRRAEVLVRVQLPGRQLDVPLSRAKFEDMVRGPISATTDTMSQVLTRADVDRSEIATILLVGGSSRIPLVARTLAAATGLPVEASGHPKYVVALGAVLPYQEAYAPAAAAGAGDSSDEPARGRGPRPPADAEAAVPARARSGGPGLATKVVLVILLFVVLVLVGFFAVRAVSAVS
jgi:molecular chaperone DnaK (HSP70)